MHINKQKLSFDIFTRNMIINYYTNDFWHKRNIHNFDPYSVFL